MLIVLFISCKSVKLSLSEIYAPAISVTENSSSEAFERMENFILPYKLRLDSSLNQVVAFNNQDLNKGVPESSLANWFADCMLRVAQRTLKSKADVALFNLGGLRTEWGKGEILKSNVFELMPFENELVSVQISKHDFLNLIQVLSKKQGAPVAGFTAEINSTTGFVKSIKLPDKDSIWVLTSDYLMNGGDNFNFGTPYDTCYFGIKLRDAIFMEFETKSTSIYSIIATTDGRVYIKE
jgi:2',3'-cyclic-nucleotide 2'-phosphodiesterase (5'-nucleotidase family)